MWKDRVHPDWKKATVPGDFVHAEFMFKNATKYTQTGSLGFARWVELEQKRYGENATFVQECFGCHTPVKYNDYVFIYPAVLS